MDRERDFQKSKGDLENGVPALYRQEEIEPNVQSLPDSTFIKNDRMSTAAPTITSKINFDRWGLFFTVLVPLVLLGFWRSYFSKFFNDAQSLTGYMHFHAVLMTGWVSLLIVQPTLIRRKKLKVHKLIGKISYGLMPLILVSMLLLVHKGGNSKPVEQQTFVDALLGLLGFFVIGACYVVAILNRHNTAVHARAMVGTGLALLDPTLMRMLGPVSFPIGSFVAIAIILGVFVALIVRERKQASGRWVFPSLLAIYFFTYSLLIVEYYTHNGINLSLLDKLMRWYYALPLT